MGITHHNSTVIQNDFLTPNSYESLLMLNQQNTLEFTQKRVRTWTLNKTQVQ